MKMFLDVIVNIFLGTPSIGMGREERTMRRVDCTPLHLLQGFVGVVRAVIFQSMGVIVSIRHNFNYMLG